MTLLTIGRHQFDHPVIAAPMAGVSDLPFRRLCLEHGASYAVAEMISANPDTHQTQKSQWRSVVDPDQAHIVQIVGHDPQQLAAAARLNQDSGADIIDINMGCPAKKVCKKAAGSALLANETLVQDMLRAVKSAVDIPVPYALRSGPSRGRPGHWRAPGAAGLHAERVCALAPARGAGGEQRFRQRFDHGALYRAHGRGRSERSLRRRGSRHLGWALCFGPAHCGSGALPRHRWGSQR